MDPLTDVTALRQAMAGPTPPVLLDVRWQLGGPPGLGAYHAGHLPRAVFTDLDADLSGPPGAGGRHPLPEAGAFQRAMRRAGVCDGRPVVVYDESHSTAAARCWWLLRYFGHERVAVLDGGYRAWLADGGGIATGAPEPPPAGDFTARPGRMPLLDAAGAAAMAGRGVLLDARAAARYRGESEPVDPVAGHIPGAVSAPVSDLTGADGRFMPGPALRARFAALGVPPAAAERATGEAEEDGIRVGCYCGSGVTAAHEVLALELAGVPAALYAGSWSHWVGDPSRPVATGITAR